MLTKTKIELRTLSLRFDLEALSPISLGEYKGSAFRGSLGHALKNISCFARQACRERCAYPASCPYGYLFETPPPADSSRMRKYPAVPHPFVLVPPLLEKSTFEPGENFSFQLVLIGKGIEYLPYFVYAFEKQGERGIGRGRGTFKVVSAKAGAGAENENVLYEEKEKILEKSKVEKSIATHSLFDSPESRNFSRITLNFLTPLRMKFVENLTTIPEFHILIRNLLRRISSLFYFHEGIEVDWNFKDLIEKAQSVKLSENKTSWYDWERYSNRQETRMRLGGLMGEVTYEGDMAAYLQLLNLGQVVHVGKNTSFGLGKYEILQAGGMR